MRQRYTFHCFLFLQSRWLFDQAPLSKNKENVATNVHQVQGEWDKVMVPPLLCTWCILCRLHWRSLAWMLDCIVFGVRTCNQGSTCIYLAYFIQKFHAEIAKNALLGLRNLKSLYKKCLSVSSSWCLPKMYSGHPTKLHFEVAFFTTDFGWVSICISFQHLSLPHLTGNLNLSTDNKV